MRISKKEKEQLQQAFSMPEPKNKKSFLRSLPKRKVSLGTLIFSQMAYIRMWVWMVSFLLFGVVILAAQYVEQDVIWVLSAFMPFAALVLVLELAKSSVYGMAELEMSSRFSLRTILLARMIMIGMVQLAGLLFSVPMAGMTLFVNGVYLFVPYLLTTLLGLVAIRRMRGNEGMFVCGSISVVIGMAAPISRYVTPVLYEQENRVVWLLVLILLFVGVVKEYKITMSRLEEFAWN